MKFVQFDIVCLKQQILFQEILKRKSKGGFFIFTQILRFPSKSKGGASEILSLNILLKENLREEPLRSQPAS